MLSLPRRFPWRVYSAISGLERGCRHHRLDFNSISSGTTNGGLCIFPFDFAPKGWAFCDGQLMPISQNTALFALLGTTYGGDGKSTFALPDLQGSALMHPGQGPGLSNHDLGEVGGNVTLLQSEIPLHNHSLMVSGRDANENDAQNLYWARASINAYTSSNQNLVTMSPQIASPAGSSLPRNNMQPYLTVSFCIALQGIFPQRP